MAEGEDLVPHRAVPAHLHREALLSRQEVCAEAAVGKRKLAHPRPSLRRSAAPLDLPPHRSPPLLLRVDHLEGAGRPEREEWRRLGDDAHEGALRHGGLRVDVGPPQLEVSPPLQRLLCGLVVSSARAHLRLGVVEGVPRRGALGGCAGEPHGLVVVASPAPPHPRPGHRSLPRGADRQVGAHGGGEGRGGWRVEGGELEGGVNSSRL
mmetsp:Transcript_17404/g.55914  ORF Transcript_17404/g.55914 Transcript_17404/m.55914 type:complete len:208 (+) Transcript_17404:1427-2050(+)